MKKRKLVLPALALVAVAALASCDDEPTTSGSAPVNTDPTTGTGDVNWDLPDYAPVQAAGKVDVITGYNQTEGSITPLKNWTDPITEVAYTKGYDKLLKTWENLATEIKGTITDQNNYSAKVSSYNNQLITDEFTGLVDKNERVDLYNTTVANINKNGGTAYVALDDYIDTYMPNFKEFLAKNPSIKEQITYNGHIYFTPYFDGYNGYERSIVMDVNVAYKVLDKKDFNNVTADTVEGSAKAVAATATDYNKEYDESTTNGGSSASANVVQAAKYQPFMDAEKNLPSNALKQTVLTYVDGVATTKEITLTQTTNIIKQQNELLATGCTGKALAEQFIKYLKTVLGSEYGTTYKYLADYFVGESAAYNVDELIALMRVVKANPGFLTDDANGEVECLFPRQTDNTGRIDNILDFAQVWGVQGLTAESEALYFDAKGALNDAYSTRATYDALEYMSQIYDEGLVDTDFYNSSSKPATRNTAWFTHQSNDNKIGFMEWDYTATQSNGNTIVNGVGTNDTKRDGASQTGIKCILPPLSYWSTTDDSTFYNALSNHTGKTITRYLEENRALKSDSWAIPVKSDNITGACILMDHLFSKTGQNTFDFVDKAYWVDGNAEGMTYNNLKTPKFTTAFFDWFTKNPSNTGDFWKYIRLNYGASLGIGYVRTASINYQATNFFAQEATMHMEDAIRLGVVTMAEVKDENTWSTSAPAQGYETPATATSYSDITTFFQTKKDSTAYGWIKYMIDPAGTYTYTFNDNVMSSTNVDALGTNSESGQPISFKSVLGQIEARKSSYLKTVVNSSAYDASYVPFYLK